jgi:sarcosine oxidase subunit gamma
VTLTACAKLALALILVRRGRSEAAARGLHDTLGLALPQPGRLGAAGADTVLWCGPDRFLALREGDDIAAPCRTALGDAAHVLDASGSRLVFQVAGGAAAEALGRLLPIDLHPRVFTPGSVAATLAAHIDVLVWRPAEAPSFRLACPASYGASLYRALSQVV